MSDVLKLMSDVIKILVAAPYTVYQFRVQAATVIGFGDFSPFRQFTTLASGELLATSYS